MYLDKRRITITITKCLGHMWMEVRWGWCVAGGAPLVEKAGSCGDGRVAGWGGLRAGGIVVGPTEMGWGERDIWIMESGFDCGCVWVIGVDGSKGYWAATLRILGMLLVCQSRDKQEVTEPSPSRLQRAAAVSLRFLWQLPALPFKVAASAAAAATHQLSFNLWRRLSLPSRSCHFNPIYKSHSTTCLKSVDYHEITPLSNTLLSSSNLPYQWLKVSVFKYNEDHGNKNNSFSLKPKLALLQALLQHL